MKLIEPKIELLEQKPGLQGIYEIIDEVAGICYNRQGIHKDSKDFVYSLIKRGHLSPLEFGTVYLQMTQDNFFNSTLPYSITNTDGKYVYITTNFRVVMEMGVLFAHICEPNEYHIKRPCFKITCSRAIADEFARHRTLSVMMKSTRYCKVDELEICKPYWYDKENKKDFGNDINPVLYHWTHALGTSNHMYRVLIENGLTPQEARGVLPLDMATEMCLCGFTGIANQGWDRFLDLRCSSAAHPDAQYLANQIKQEIYKYVHKM